MFKAKLFDLLTAAHFITIGGYAISSEDWDRMPTKWEFVWEDYSWTFQDQEVTVDEHGETTVECSYNAYRYEGDGKITVLVILLQRRRPIVAEDVDL